ncbi:MAG TPA: CHAT domain-containing protein [Methylomusa anaerophila]|nr:CHAT domain-containing tetratricopeptide repeat protein [Methylomusa anaerophila]HML88996.1 CHAT domain-containing protein [Methylomusa anaerophila]
MVRIVLIVIALYCWLTVQPAAAAAGAGDTGQLKARVEAQIAAQGENNPDVLAAMLELIAGYWQQGRHGESLPWSEKALRLSRNLFGEKHAFTLSCMSGLATDYRSLGRYSEALALDERLLVLRQEVLGDKHPDTLAAMSNLASDYRRLGRYEDALTLDETTVNLKTAVLGAKHPETLTGMNNLAADYRKLGRFQEAMPVDKQALATRTEILGEKHPATLASLNNLASDYYAMGWYGDAAPLQEKALRLSAETLGDKHPDFLACLANLALTYHKMGRYAEALALEEKSVKLRAEVLGEQHPETLISLNNMAADFYIQGRNNEAAAYLQKLVDGVEELRRSGDLSPENRQAFFAQWIQSYKNFALLALEQKDQTKAFHLAELTKARTLLELTANRLADASGVLSPDESARLDDYQVRITRYNDLLANVLDKAVERARLETEKNDLLREYGQYRASLMDKYPKYRQLNEVNIMEAAAAQRLVPPQTVMISYVQTSDNKVIAFVLDSAAGLKGVSLGEIPQLDQMAATFREVLATRDINQLRENGKYLWRLADGSYILTDSPLKPAESAEPLKDNKQLYAYVSQTAKYLGDKLLAPVAADIQGKRQWLISPDGTLNLLPFETLFLNDRQVVLDHDVSYIQSLSMLALLKQRGEEARWEQFSGKDLFAMGAAYYQGPGSALNGNTRVRGGSLQDLRSSEPELDALAGLFSSARCAVYKKGAATEAKLLELNKSKELARYRYLLFSVHGYFDAAQPDMNSIVLGQKDLAPGTDGFVTVTKWPGYSLNSDLVYLSACETGRGKFVPGEGVLGLTYVLYVAGNKNTVATLWKTLDDDSAVEFSKSFFAKLMTGQDQVRALNETKREFISGGRYSLPVYWAPFVLYGI